MSCDQHVDVKSKLENHEVRIQKLELDNVEFKTELKNLIENVRELINWIKFFLGSAFVGAVGFIIWYIQSIGK